MFKCQQCGIKFNYKPLHVFFDGECRLVCRCCSREEAIRAGGYAAGYKKGQIDVVTYLLSTLGVSTNIPESEILSNGFDLLRNRFIQLNKQVEWREWENRRLIERLSFILDLT
jgi:hypothetical protein